MLSSGNCVRCLDATGYPLTSGANYLVDVGQVDGGAMISLVGYEGAFLASRFELVEGSPSSMAETALNREQLVDKCVAEGITRISAAASCAVKRLHILIDRAAIYSTAAEVAERSEHMCERVDGCNWATDWTVDLCGVDSICEKFSSGSPFDLEQLTHDVKVKLKQFVREL